MRALASDQGFTLIETVMSTMMVALLISGLLLVWHLAETKGRDMDGFAQTKTALETAYEVTSRSLRQYASANIFVAEDHHKISFQDDTGVTWAFIGDGADFKKISGDGEELLLNGNCGEVYFEMNGRNVIFRIKAVAPVDEPDLTVQGTVFLRNWRG